MIVVIEARELPGIRCGPNPEGGFYENIHVGLCCRGKPPPGAVVVAPSRPWRVTDLVRADALSARWVIDVEVVDDDGIDFKGKYVRGARDDRHIGLAWGELRDDAFHLFRAAKLRFDAVDAAVVGKAAEAGHELVASLGLTDACGFPRCASVKPPDITWTARRSPR